jgi:hypothetical protein
MEFIGKPLYAMICARTVATIMIAERITTTVGPTLIPGVSSSKNLMRPAPPLGIGPSPFFFLRFLVALGIGDYLLELDCLHALSF